MRFFFFLILFYGSLSSMAAQTAYTAADIPPEYLQNANTVIRQHETVFKVTGADEAELEEWIVITVLNKAGDPAATCSEIEDEFEKVKVMKGALYDAEGHLIRESKKQDARDYSASNDNEFVNTKVKLLEMEYGQYPYTVEFRVRKVIKGFFRTPDFVVQRLGQSVIRTSITFTAPSAYAYKWKGLHADAAPEIREAGGEKTTEWKFANLPAVPKESYHPYFNNEYCKIIVAPMQVQIDGYDGNFSDWKQIGAFFYHLNKNRDVLSSEMQTTVRTLIQGKNTRREKIDVLYKYLQQNHRYVSIQIGIGGWQTLEASFVERKKYGDCKALSNYMQALLKEAGIESYAADIYAGNAAPEWYDDAPVPYANHVILYVPGENLWLECTSNQAPAGYLSDFTSGRKALLLTPEGGKIVQTPAQTVADNMQISHTSIRLDETGAADVQSTVFATCDMHDMYRYWNAEKKQPDMEKEFVETIGFPIAQLNKLQISISASAPQATIDYALKINSIVTKSGKRMFMPINKTNPFKTVLPANDKRVLDLTLRMAYTMKDTVDIQLPPGYVLENMPPAKHIESEFGRYDLQAVKQDDNKVRVFRHIEIQPVSVPAARYNEVRQFYQELTKADGAQMVLVKSE